MYIKKVSKIKMIVGTITFIFFTIFSFNIFTGSNSIIVKEAKSDTVCNEWNMCFEMFEQVIEYPETVDAGCATICGLAGRDCFSWEQGATPTIC